MKTFLFTQSMDTLNSKQCIANLESGKVLFFPDYYFSNVDNELLRADLLNGKRKNVSYDSRKKQLHQSNTLNNEIESRLKKMMQEYADFAFDMIEKTLPFYIPHLEWGRTSFRPAMVQGRAISKRKDDSRLHVDSFSATPVQGKRILRVFCNVNPDNQPRVWNIGEPFEYVLERFASKIATYNKFKAHVLHFVKSTKSLRTAYDHYMLQLHDQMKLDDHYQNSVKKTEVNFPAKSSWIVFTDQVSHAALGGQHLLEQTFYLPIEKMNEPESSPLMQWQKFRPEIKKQISIR